jgi:hypothetical protein
MKAKLIKTDKGNYILIDPTKGTYDTGYLLGTTRDDQVGMLSIKNCQSIENGYDLDEEVSNIVKTIVPDDRGRDIWYGTSMAVGKLCFQKALKILGDNNFSEEDVINSVLYGMQKGLDIVKVPETDNDWVINYIKSLQQTEWDVEIIEECLDKNCNGINKKGDCITTGKPKLDEDGCLILKKL